jgi:hypothetical protein
MEPCVTDPPSQPGAAVSVVIPAHNETGVIGRLLDALLRDARPGEFDVYVVCNGCSDDTARIAAAYGGVNVIELALASKSRALQAGDSAAGDVFPRVYLDADITVSTDAVRKVARALAVGAPRAGAPQLAVATSGRPFLVRGFYRVLLQLPWVTDNLVGSGFYGVSRAGRQRFGAFPELVNDDQFIRHLFARDERVAVPEAQFTIQAPYSTFALIRAKARVSTGIAEFSTLYPTLTAEGQPVKAPRGGSLMFLPVLAKPANWPWLVAYAFVRGAARVLAVIDTSRGLPVAWGQDRTTREAPSRP